MTDWRQVVEQHGHVVWQTSEEKVTDTFFDSKWALGMMHVRMRLIRLNGDDKGPEGRQNIAGDVSPPCTVMPSLAPARVPAAKPPGRRRAKLTAEKVSDTFFAVGRS